MLKNFMTSLKDRNKKLLTKLLKTQTDTDKTIKWTEEARLTKASTARVPNIPVKTQFE